jgi:hypothetical protein
MATSSSPRVAHVRRRGWTLSASTICSASVLAVACSEGMAPTAGAESIDGFVGGLPAWTTFSPLMGDTNDIVGTGTVSLESVGGTVYDCRVEPYSITQTPEKIVTLDPDVNVLWLGALLQGNGYKEGIGSLSEWAVRERAPLRVSIDLLSGDNFRTVEDPDLASVNQAVGQLVSAAQAASHRGGSSVSFSQETTHSLNQAAISLGISYRFVGAGVRASLSAAASRRASEQTITAYFVQRMFTASVVLPSEPSDLFSEEFTPARLDEEIARGHVGSSNPPVYVANIAYGRILMFSMTASTTRDSIRAAISAAFTKEDTAGISASYLNILSHAQISVATVGGEGKNAAALIQSGKIADYFNDDAALTSARPISYTVRNLGDNSIARVSETTEYNLRECTAVPTTGTIRVDVTPNDATVTVVGAGGYQSAPKVGDQLYTELVPGGYVVSATATGYTDARIDTVSVVAGYTTDVILSMLTNSPTQPIGAIYRVTPTRVTLVEASCTGESQPDLFHTFRVNNKTLVNRAESDAISLYESQWDDSSKPGATWTAVTDTILFASESELAFSGEVYDDDGALNFNETVGIRSWSYTRPNIPTGDRAAALGSVCQVHFNYNIAKLGDVF